MPPVYLNVYLFGFSQKTQQTIETIQSSSASQHEYMYSVKGSIENNMARFVKEVGVGSGG